MAEGHDDTKDKLTLLEALKDFGWLPLVLMGVGGLSIIDILETAVFHDLNLITPFQIVLNGYHRITNLIGVIFEPLVQPAIDWINAHWTWHLYLQPFWRSLFVLGMVLLMSIVRAGWRAGRWGTATMSLVAGGLGLLIGSVATGLLPSNNQWWVQGLLAAVPMATMQIAGTLGEFSVLRRLSSKANPYRALRASFLLIPPLLLFVAGASVSLVGVRGSGILALGIFIALMGAAALFIGLNNAFRGYTRIGLSALGGFVAAGLILLSNWAVIALS